MTLSLLLRLAERRVGGAEAVHSTLAQAHEELTLALAELRELATGLHPAVLSDRGLRAALDGLAARSPLPVRVVCVPEERLPEPVEVAVY